MIGLNWKKSLVVAGAMLAVAAAVPAAVSGMTRAHTPDVLPLGTGMTDAPVVAPVKKVSTRKVATHKKVTKKAAVKHTKHKVSKKHTKLSTKKHAV